ncbi:MAG: tetratricopeptide repeat protein, partial [Cyanobacteria bacterium J06649_4]
MQKTLRLLGIVVPWCLLIGSIPARANPSVWLSQSVDHQEAAQVEPLLSVGGILTETDKKLEDSSRYDSHTFSGQAGQIITIILKSNDFDPVLILNTSSGELVDGNDDSDEGSTAKIIVRLPFTGEYQILANAYSATGRGRYQLTVNAASDEETYQAERYEDLTQLLEQGFELVQRSQLKSANTVYENALVIALELGDRENEAGILNNIGLALHGQGNYLQALDYYEQSLEIAKEIENIEMELLIQANIGTVYLSQGNFAQSLDTFEQNLEAARSLGDRVTESIALINTGGVYLTQGSYAEATAYFEQALELSRKTESPSTETLALSNLGSAYLSQENYAQGITYLEQSLAISQSLGDRPTEA